MKPKYLLTVSGIILALGALFWFVFIHEPERALEPQEVIILPGTSHRSIAEMLHERGLTPFPEVFLAYLALRGPDHLQAGRYVFQGNESVRTIVDILAGGTNAWQRITLPEGLTSRQMASIFEEAGIASQDEYLALVEDPDRFGLPWLEGSPTLEGYLFPDTYFLLPGIEAESVIETQLKRFEELFLEDYRNGDSPLSLPELVTLASIVEKETRWEHEQPLVASVFLNRLERNMRLQSCATVIYALQEEQGVAPAVLTIEELEIESPFNTYREAGLPPAPIANPGLSSLQAVLNPVSSDYLFFVLYSDGQHRFSRDYTEHLNYRDAARQ